MMEEEINARDSVVLYLVVLINKDGLLTLVVPLVLLGKGPDQCVC